MDKDAYIEAEEQAQLLYEEIVCIYSLEYGLTHCGVILRG